MTKISKDPKRLGRNIKIASQKANLNKRVTSHIFRHSYATLAHSSFNNKLSFVSDMITLWMN